MENRRKKNCQEKNIMKSMTWTKSRDSLCHVSHDFGALKVLYCRYNQFSSPGTYLEYLNLHIGTYIWNVSTYILTYL